MPKRKTNLEFLQELKDKNIPYTPLEDYIDSGTKIKWILDNVEGARERIFVTTDKARGTLKEFSDESGYETFVIPDDVGGRYSVLTACGLLPIAVAGINIDEMIIEELHDLFFGLW